MEIYRFRQLTNETDYDRLKNILETGYFWCSNFWDLNDPMEGVFSTYNVSIIDKIFKAKEQYKICSFSSEKGFKNPIMWGYYAAGFKGVAIEVNEVNEVNMEENDIKKVNYDDSKILLNSNDLVDVDEILLHKNTAWKHEYEYRFLKKSENNNYHKIGKITAVYFGNPYGNLNNSGVIQVKEKLAKYNELKKRLISVTKGKKIHCYNARSVRIKNTIQIVKDDEL